jgi:pyruvate-formate lyase-activating enzyme
MHPYRGEFIRIKPCGLPPLLVTPDHAVFVASHAAGPVHKLPAHQVNTAHFMVVPKPEGESTQPTLDVARLLHPFVGVFRRSRQRKASIALLTELAGAGGRRRTSTDIGRQLGYHPAYVRTLLSKVRRGCLSPDSEEIGNDLVQRDGHVRFKAEKGSGIPCRLPLNADLARLLGYYCAEGHVTAQRGRPNSRRLIFSFGRHESDLADAARALIEALFHKHPVVRQRRTTLTVEIGSSSLALLFEDLCGAKSRSKRVPAVLFTAPTEVVGAFLDAYFHGDGCRQPGYVVTNTVSADLAFGVLALLCRVGIFPYYYATPRAGTQMIEGREVRQSPTLHYVKCRREAWDGHPAVQRVPYVDTPHAFYVPIRKISRLPYDGPVYNLEVADEDHSYIAGGLAVGNCQNFETSQIGEGEEVGPPDLARMMLRLQEEGCHNINFVTPEHVVPQILEALLHAVEGGLRLPLVYNTSAYDSVHSIALMDAVVDVYMPDFKLWDRERSRRYLLAPNYPEAARTVIRAMHEQVGPLKVTEDGLAVRGVLVRHLVMPGLLEDTHAIMDWLAGLSADTYVNIMDQYYPAYRAKTEEKFRDINRRTRPAELDEAFAHARAAGLWRFDSRWRQMPASARLWA